MNTIDYNVLADAAVAVEAMDLRYVHTVTIELNGATGGADLIVKGFDSNDVSLYNERTIKVRL